MLNQIILVGRLVQDPKIKELENGQRVSYITLAVPRSYKNSDGIYETDFIPVKLWSGVAENPAEYCRKGDSIGIKGRVQRIDTSKPIEIIADKVMFLSSRKESEEE